MCSAGRTSLASGESLGNQRGEKTIVTHHLHRSRKKTKHGRGFSDISSRYFRFQTYFTSHARDIVEFQPRSLSTFLVFFFL